MQIEGVGICSDVKLEVDGLRCAFSVKPPVKWRPTKLKRGTKHRTGIVFGKTTTLTSGDFIIQ